MEIAAYAEIHQQARNLEDDIANFVRKAKAGADNALAFNPDSE